MFMGPCGLISIDEGHRPDWVKATFDKGELDGDDPSDDQVTQILKLIKDGHARLLANVGHMHVTTKVAVTLVGDTDIDDEEEKNDHEKDQENDQEKKDQGIEEEEESLRKKAKR